MPIYSPRIVSDATIPSYTWSTKPSAASYTGYIRVTDVGINGTLWRSDGVSWYTPDTGQLVFLASGCNIGIPSSGTIGNNGALSGVTAFNTTFNVPGVYLYFPANAISAGSAAGFYWTVMSSTTAGTIYNNQPNLSKIVPPASNTAFSTTGPGAYTQTTSEITLSSTTLPGGCLGTLGHLTVVHQTQTNSNANAKAIRVKLGATEMTLSNTFSRVNDQQGFQIYCAGSNTQQTVSRVSSSYIGESAASSAGTQKSADLSVDTTLAVTLQLAVATDNAILLNHSVCGAPCS